MRGEAGAFPLDAKTIKIAGYSLARQFKEKSGKTPRFITGKDTRESGLWIENAFHAGALAGGAECESAGVITTPGVAFLTRDLSFDAGIVISASHNPFHDNGVKIFLPSGQKLDSDTENVIESDIDADIFGEIADIEIAASKSAELQDRYLNYLAAEFPDLDLANLKMVVDCANGAASDLAPRLFAKFGAEIVVINHQPDGKNINRDCGSQHLAQLQAKVLETKADFGVAFDGDADRSLFVDSNGELVDGDAVLWAMAQFFQAKNELENETIVATVMSNLGLEVALRSRGINLLRASVGDKYVLEELLKSGATVGGEQSGHIIFPKRNLVGDGMQTTLFLLESMQESGKSLVEMTNGFVRFPQILINVKVKQKLPFESVPEIVDASKQIENELGDKGRLLLRYSGTENLARVMLEGEDQESINIQARRLAHVIEQSLGN